MTLGAMSSSLSDVGKSQALPLVDSNFHMQSTAQAMFGFNGGAWKIHRAPRGFYAIKI